MGVTGTGKTTIGSLLSQSLGFPFYDGDDFHPPENIHKMSRGIPLNDRDRLPWLLALRDLIARLISEGNSGIIACSALKQAYRELLQGDRRDIIWIYLKGDYDEVLSRIKQRQKHFMKEDMLRSQFEALEEPNDAFTVSISASPNDILEQILDQLKKI